MHVSLSYQENYAGNNSTLAQVPDKSDKSTSLGFDSPWHRIAKDFNITKCTYDTLMQAITELYLDSEISHKEFETFRIDKKNNDSLFASRGYNVKTNPYRTPADEEGNRNWLKEFEIKLLEARNRGDENTFFTMKRIVAILTQLYSAREELSGSKA